MFLDLPLGDYGVCCAIQIPLTLWEPFPLDTITVWLACLYTYSGLQNNLLLSDFFCLNFFLSYFQMIKQKDMDKSTQNSGFFSKEVFPPIVANHSSSWFPKVTVGCLRSSHCPDHHTNKNPLVLFLKCCVTFTTNVTGGTVVWKSICLIYYFYFMFATLVSDPQTNLGVSQRENEWKQDIVFTKIFFLLRERNKIRN